MLEKVALENAVHVAGAQGPKSALFGGAPRSSRQGVGGRAASRGRDPHP